MTLNPQDVLLKEFGAYYNSDELELLIHDYLEEQADESAARMVHILGDRAVEVATLMREMALDTAHPFYQTIRERTMYAWDDEPYTWEKFQTLAQRMSDGIAKILKKSLGENKNKETNSARDESLPNLTTDDTQQNQ